MLSLVKAVRGGTERVQRGLKKLESSPSAPQHLDIFQTQTQTNTLNAISIAIKIRDPTPLPSTAVLNRIVVDGEVELAVIDSATVWIPKQKP